MRANANPPSRGSAPRVGSRASAPSAGRCSEKVHCIRAWRRDTWQTTKWPGSDGARTGRMKTRDSSGRGGFGRCGVLREFVRARWVRACVRVAWSAARRPRHRPAVVAKISLFRFRPRTGKQSHVVRHQNRKSLREIFRFHLRELRRAGLLADREKERITPFDRVSVGLFNRSSASIVGRTHRIL